jgi:hypothetical protein
VAPHREERGDRAARPRNPRVPPGAVPATRTPRATSAASRATAPNVASIAQIPTRDPLPGPSRASETPVMSSPTAIERRVAATATSDPRANADPAPPVPGVTPEVPLDLLVTAPSATTPSVRLATAPLAVTHRARIAKGERRRTSRSHVHRIRTIDVTVRSNAPRDRRGRIPDTTRVLTIADRVCRRVIARRVEPARPVPEN